MKHPSFVIANAVVLLCLVCLAVAQQPRRQPPPRSGSSPAARPAQPKPIRVLVRVTRLSRVAIDGAESLDALDDVLKKLPPRELDDLKLQPGDGLLVQEERDRVVRWPAHPGASQQWEIDPGGFDFLVEWTIRHEELKKPFPLSSLGIISEETVEATKVSDPSQKKKWRANYVFSALFTSGLTTNPDYLRMDATYVFLPVLRKVRAPVMRDIRAFLASRPMPPVKVLVRVTETADLPPDHARILEDLYSKLDKAQPDALQDVKLESGLGIEVTEERHGWRSPSTVEWKTDPAGFDFVVHWTISYTDTKKMFEKIKGNWNVEVASASSPSLKHSWTGSYELREDSSVEDFSEPKLLRNLRFFILFPEDKEARSK